MELLLIKPLKHIFVDSREQVGLKYLRLYKEKKNQINVLFEFIKNNFFDIFKNLQNLTKTLVEINP